MYQQITIVGNVGSDPEMRYTPSGVPVTSMSVAVNKSWTDSNGERQEKVIWFKITGWRKLAEIMQQYVKKGRQVLVVGEIEDAKPWTDRDGNQRVSLEVTAQVVRVIGPRGEGDSGGGENQQSGGKPGGGNGSSRQENNEPDEEDIPF